MKSFEKEFYNLAMLTLKKGRDLMATAQEAVESGFFSDRDKKELVDEYINFTERHLQFLKNDMEVLENRLLKAQKLKARNKDE